MFTNENPPSTTDYLSALSSLQEHLSETQLRIFQVQYSNPGRALTSQELRDTLGYKGIGASNIAYGNLGKLMAGKVGFLVHDQPPRRPGWWRALSTSDGAASNTTWFMRRQLAAALEQIGIVSTSDDGFVDAPDIDLPQQRWQAVVEGSKKLSLHLRRERSRRLIAAKKASAATLNCEICGFNSLAVYGVDYCEAHHLSPLSDLDEETVTTLDDLALVCANCHRIIHSECPPYSIEHVKNLIRDRMS